MHLVDEQANLELGAQDQDAQHTLSGQDANVNIEDVLSHINQDDVVKGTLFCDSQSMGLLIITNLYRIGLDCVDAASLGIPMDISNTDMLRVVDEQAKLENGAQDARDAPSQRGHGHQDEVAEVARYSVSGSTLNQHEEASKQSDRPMLPRMLRNVSAACIGSALRARFTTSKQAHSAWSATWMTTLPGLTTHPAMFQRKTWMTRASSTNPFRGGPYTVDMQPWTHRTRSWRRFHGNLRAYGHDPFIGNTSN